ncbi:MAG: hypothetical protein H7A25_22090 [Leptospiraceae bacterium]|nr:hypothetical protein [Leptospiraceae bacterium]
MELLSEIEGKIVIFLQELNRDLDIDSYCASIKEDEINAINSPTKRFYTYHIKIAKNFINTYPCIYPEDITDNFHNKYKCRFERLHSLINGMYHFKIIHTLSSIQNIINYSKSKKITRILVFNSIDLVSDYMEILKIFKLNSFLSYREMNIFQSTNLYSNNGFIRNKTINRLFEGKGKGKGIGKYTFEALELSIDMEVNSNLSYINKIAKI